MKVLLRNGRRLVYVGNTESLPKDTEPGDEFDEYIVLPDSKSDKKEVYTLRVEVFSPEKNTVCVALET